MRTKQVDIRTSYREALQPVHRLPQPVSTRGCLPVLSMQQSALLSSPAEIHRRVLLHVPLSHQFMAAASSSSFKVALAGKARLRFHGSFGLLHSVQLLTDDPAQSSEEQSEPVRVKGHLRPLFGARPMVVCCPPIAMEAFSQAANSWYAHPQRTAQTALRSKLYPVHAP